MFYGDAGSVHVLERVGLTRAKAVVVLLDTPAAMYRYGRPDLFSFGKARVLGFSGPSRGRF